MPGAFLIAKGQTVADVGLKATNSGSLFIELLSTPTVARQLTATNSGQNQALTVTCNRISIRCRANDCRYTIGTTNQSGIVSSASSHFIVAGERLDIAVPDGANFGYIRDSAAAANGILEITELV